MTANIVNYLNYRETQRSNLARESEERRSNLAKEHETSLHNRNVEAETLRYNQAALAELNRHQLVTEGQSDQKMANDYKIGSANVVETHRHNLATEYYDTNYLSEIGRHNLATETENWTHNRETESETERHNRQMESIEDVKAKAAMRRANTQLLKDGVDTTFKIINNVSKLVASYAK